MFYRGGNTFIIWISLELITWGIFPFFFLKRRGEGVEISFKFFIIQRLASLGGVIGLEGLHSPIFEGGELFLLIFFLRILLKAGGFPFSGWILEIVKEKNLVVLFLVRRIQKLAPFILMGKFLLIYGKINLIIKIIIIFNILIASWSLINFQNILFLLFFSSIYHLSIVFLIFFVGGGRKVGFFYFFYYVFFIMFFFIYLNKGKRISKSNISSQKEWGFFIIFLALSGLPPYLIFYIKIFFLFNIFYLWGEGFFLLLIPAMLIYIVRFLLFIFEGCNELTPVKILLLESSLEEMNEDQEIVLMVCHSFFFILFILFF